MGGAGATKKDGLKGPVARAVITAEDVFTHFDRWLSANGWTYSGNGTPSVGDQAAVPEGRFLRPEQIRRYDRTGDPKSVQ